MAVLIICVRFTDARPGRGTGPWREAAEEGAVLVCMTAGHISAAQIGLREEKYYKRRENDSSMCAVLRATGCDPRSFLNHAAILSLRCDRHWSRPQWADGSGLPGRSRPVHAGAGAARNCRRLLRNRGNCARLPRFDYLLYCQHAAAGSDPRPGAGFARVADGALRSGAAGAVPGWPGGALVDGARAHGGGTAQDFRSRC